MAIRVKVILGSTRQQRFGDKPAAWMAEEARKHADVDVELLDLRDYQLPFFDSPAAPAWSKGVYADPAVQRWADRIADGDAFIMVTPEYNHGYSAVLKNAIDSIYPEWVNKAVGFVSYGNVGGARAIEQARLVAIELQMWPIKTAIHIPPAVYLAVRNEPLPPNPDLFKPLRDGYLDHVERFFKELLWAAHALKNARAAGH